jgi:hypothetical protein
MSFFDAAFTLADRPVRLADADPDLAADRPPGAPAIALSFLRLPLGRWEASAEIPHGTRAVLVLDGVLVRTVRVGAQCRAELLGEGDLLCPWDVESDLGSIDSAVEWQVLQPARLGLLDDDFFAAASGSARLVGSLTVRGVRRAQRLALQLAIADVRRIDERMVALLLHIGDRWGKMTPEGIHIPLRLTHDLIAHLLGAQRPTVTTSLNNLERAGRLLRRSDRTWVVRTAVREAASAA